VKPFEFRYLTEPLFSENAVSNSNSNKKEINAFDTVIYDGGWPASFHLLS
jgi:hypothetical protein